MNGPEPRGRQVVHLELLMIDLSQLLVRILYDPSTFIPAPRRAYGRRLLIEEGREVVVDEVYGLVDDVVHEAGRLNLLLHYNILIVIRLLS